MRRRKKCFPRSGTWVTGSSRSNISLMVPGPVKQKRSAMPKWGGGWTPGLGVLPRFWKRMHEQKTTEDEQLRLGHLLKVLTHLRPGLVQCYDVEGFPRTNNDLERTIRAVKMHYRRISGRKNWNSYLLRYGRCVAYQEWWHQQPDGDACLQTRLQQVAPASWRQVRQETRDHHQEQLNRYRFRHRPLIYLETLEARWEQASCT
jgi:hypothetical protein